MFINGLPSFMAERVYNSLNKAYPEQIPWENLTYAQLTSKIIECGLDICNEIKIQTKVQKHSNLHKKEMKTFCSQYGFEKIKELGTSSRKVHPRNYNMKPTYYRKSQRYNKPYTPKRYHKYSNYKKPTEKQQKEA